MIYNGHPMEIWKYSEGRFSCPRRTQGSLNPAYGTTGVSLWLICASFSPISTPWAGKSTLVLCGERPRLRLVLKAFPPINHNMCDTNSLPSISEDHGDMEHPLQPGLWVLYTSSLQPFPLALDSRSTRRVNPFLAEEIQAQLKERKNVQGVQNSFCQLSSSKDYWEEKPWTTVPCHNVQAQVIGRITVINTQPPRCSVCMGWYFDKGFA